jgi:hypothetical protein
MILGFVPLLDPVAGGADKGARCMLVGVASYHLMWSPEP